MLNEQEYTKVIDECLALGRKKNNDYSGSVDNISAMGIGGIAVRLFDKVCRLHSLTHGTQQKVMDESVRDTLRDTINYAVYGIMMIDGTWGNVDCKCESPECKLHLNGQVVCKRCGGAARRGTIVNVENEA